MNTPSLLVLLWSSVQGATVKNNPKEAVTIGGNVTLQCQLIIEEPNVIQITWQKETGNFTGAVATISKVYGQKLIGYYSNRTKHSASNSPDVSAISISNVTPEDEGCFKCIFNLFPSGATTGTICLEVYEPTILEPNLEVLEIDNRDIADKLYTVTCSVNTGKPTPNITWILPGNLNITPETHTTRHLNETETVTSNFTLPLSSIWDMRVSVICVVRHPGLSAEKHLSTVIDGTRNHNETLKIQPIIIAATMIVLGSVIVIVLLILLGNWRRYGHNPENKSLTTL
ncbi:OX-2 membrane glycoprotein-like [Leptodactylus fuscus]|uniref:OX-2 membrane glycoprotein-like n=1 Tax=Leptodactylus fuscus TaxID=238119 RepID=UPI003F4E4F3A